MKRIKIESSTIKSIGYDFQACILEIEFIKGTIYQYRQVSALEISKLLFADSIGSYFMKNIKDKYNYEKIS